MKKILSIMLAVFMLASLCSVFAFADEAPDYSQFAFNEDQAPTIEAIVAMHPYSQDDEYCTFRYYFTFTQEDIDPSFGGGFEAWWGIGEPDPEPFWASEEALAAGVIDFTTSVAAWDDSGWDYDMDLGGQLYMEVRSFDIPDYNAYEEYEAAKEGRLLGYICEHSTPCDEEHIITDTLNQGVPDMVGNYEMTNNQYMAYNGDAPHDAIVRVVQTAEDFFKAKGVAYEFETEEVEDETEAPEVDETEVPDDDTAAPVDETAAPADETAAPADETGADTKAPEKKSGCGSVVASIALIPMLLAAAYVSKKH